VVGTVLSDEPLLEVVVVEILGLGFSVASEQAKIPAMINNSGAKFNFFMVSICLSLKYNIVSVAFCHLIFDWVFKVLDEKQKENLRYD
jgi:hypothetical protein